MVESLFQGEDLESDMESFFGALDKIDHSLSKILKDHLGIVSSAPEDKTSRSAFNAAVSAAILTPIDEEKSE